MIHSLGYSMGVQLLVFARQSALMNVVICSVIARQSALINVVVCLIIALQSAWIDVNCSVDRISFSNNGVSELCQMHKSSLKRQMSLL